MTHSCDAELARLDSNQDQLIQSQPCCRYTTGHRVTWSFRDNSGSIELPSQDNSGRLEQPGMTRITAQSLSKAAPGTSPTLLDVLPRFRRHLAAENKSARTIKSYSESVERLHEFLTAAGMPLRVSAI